MQIVLSPKASQTMDNYFNNDNGIDEDMDPILDFMNRLSDVTI